jgi:hypothetical protein
MIKKNVYIVFPAGYHGSYIKWAIEVSDIDRRKTTVLDPLNRKSSTTLGGVGTSHGHARIPTHQSFDGLNAWIIRNRPVDKMVYIIGHSTTIQFTYCTHLMQLLLADPTGIIIIINDGNDLVAQSYGRINSVTKWPTFMACCPPYIDDETFGIHKNFNPFDCATDRVFRNSMITTTNQLNINAYDFSTPIGTLNFEYLDEKIAWWNWWYKVRNRYQPHEINEETYVAQIDYTDRLYQLNLTDIPSNKFLSQLQNILSKTEISDNFDLDVVKNYHSDYISAQPNLQWFESFAHWNQTGELDDYILSHSIIEAELLREIMRKCNIRNIKTYTEEDHYQWQSFYNHLRGPDWPECPQTEDGFHQLPEWVKKEILIDFKYTLKNPGKPDPIMAALDWENMSLQDINLVYQTQIKKVSQATVLINNS